MRSEGVHELLCERLRTEANVSIPKEEGEISDEDSNGGKFLTFHCGLWQRNLH
jgi:hypothetical protein